MMARKRAVAAYDVAKAVYEERLAAIDGVRALDLEIAMNGNSARDYFYVYRKMRDGEVFQRGLSVDDMGYFLDRIREDSGEDAHASAIRSVWLHVGYYEALRSIHMRAMRRMLEERSLSRAVASAPTLDPNAAVPPAHCKVARLCWNTNAWQSPSGRFGKVGSQKAFEGEFGFGHEEWLLDHSRLVDGWKYGFIQALNHSFEKYSGATIDLLLYTIDNKTKRRYWVASISGVEVLTEKQSSQVRRMFETNGWLDEMREQVEMLGLDDGTLGVERPQDLLNLRYRPEQCVRFDPMIEFPAEELPAAYYGTFQQVPNTQIAVLHGATHVDALKERNIGKLTSMRTTHADVREVDLTHKRWQEELGKSLREQLPNARIAVETKLGPHFVDIVIDVGKTRILVELKTCSVARQAIREALSQLLEYAYRPPAGPRGDVLLIVCAGREDEADREYMQMLRDRFGIPVHYLQYRQGVIVDIQGFVAQVASQSH
jgi:hypothetical protein